RTLGVCDRDRLRAARRRKPDRRRQRGGAVRLEPRLRELLRVGRDPCSREAAAMNELLSSLKADLSSRRMLPLVVMAAVALVGALAYVALASTSGGSKAALAPPNVTPVSPLPGP